MPENAYEEIRRKNEETDRRYARQREDDSAEKVDRRKKHKERHERAMKRLHDHDDKTAP